MDQSTALSAQILALSNQFATFTTYRAQPKKTTVVANTSDPTVATASEQAQYMNNRNLLITLNYSSLTCYDACLSVGNMFD